VARSSPGAFKGIALFTPGGDLAYCIDPSKQMRWHAQLCGLFQQSLSLAEPPHFLASCYAATVDCILEPQSQSVQYVAEASPFVLRYQSLLNAVFDTTGLKWKPLGFQPELCDRAMLRAYRDQYPQLWEGHDLVLRYQPVEPAVIQPVWWPGPTSRIRATTQGYVLRLFVAGHSAATENTLKRLHGLLEQVLDKQVYTLKVVDVSQHPEEAEQNQISATPTLLRVHPQPVHRIVGSLESVDQLLSLLHFRDSEWSAND
jgi:circadian clock protein KaiB